MYKLIIQHNTRSYFFLDFGNKEEAQNPTKGNNLLPFDIIKMFTYQ